MIGSFGFLNANKRSRSCSRRSRSSVCGIRARACSSSGRRRRDCTWRADRAARPRRRRRAPRLRRRAALLVAARRVRRLRLAPLADDGRDVRGRDPDALAREADRRLDVDAFAELPDEVAVKSRRTSARWTRSRVAAAAGRGSVARGEDERGRTRVRAARARLDESPTSTSALEEAAGGAAVRDELLREVASRSRGRRRLRHARGGGGTPRGRAWPVAPPRSTRRRRARSPSFARFRSGRG